MSPARDESVADLGHRLRTPLTHIIGYSALLLEGGEADPDTEAHLKSVSEHAETIHTRMDCWLAPGSHSGMSGQRTAGLRADIAKPLREIVRTIGLLMQNAEGSVLLDILRIGRACTELQAFLQDESSPSRVSTRPLPPVQHSGVPNGEVTPSSRILVIDDNRADLEMLERQLGRYGHTAVLAENGGAGLQALESERFDLVLLDVIMPGMNGVEVLQKIKAVPAMADVPVIMTSALDEVESAAQCIELSAEDYLLKPLDPVLLRARLNSALERRRLGEERRERTRELERIAEDLQRANDDLQSFASVAAHDLQEPLRTITTTLQLFELESGDELAEDQRALLNMAVEGAGRMSRLISGLLAYSFAGSVEGELVTVPCEAALLEAVNNLRGAIKDSGARISHGALPQIPAHPGGLVQLFQNLIGNAIKYRSQDRPRIRISAEREGHEWVISVEDNGIGIEEKYRGRIFQPFGRLHGQERPGTGLGLAICERIVRKSGGRIWVQSTPGEGSIFSFTAPDASEAGEAAP